jgi:hypothetical protein
VICELGVAAVNPAEFVVIQIFVAGWTGKDVAKSRF